MQRIIMAVGPGVTMVPVSHLDLAKLIQID